MFKLDLDRGTRNQISNICWVNKKQENSRKTSTSALLTTLKPLTVDHNKLWKILKEMGISDALPASWETCMQVKKQLFKLYMAQWTGSKFREEYVKAV